MNVGLFNFFIASKPKPSLLSQITNSEPFLSICTLLSVKTPSKSKIKTSIVFIDKFFISTLVTVL